MSQNKEWLAASDAWMIYSRELAALKENVDQQVWLQVLDALLNAVENCGDGGGDIGYCGP